MRDPARVLGTAPRPDCTPGPGATSRFSQAAKGGAFRDFARGAQAATRVAVS